MPALPIVRGHHHILTQGGFDTRATTSRRFYRLVSRPDPHTTDFLSPAEAGRHYDVPAVQERAEEVSVWDTVEAARRLALKKPALRYIATLEIPAHIDLRPGKRGHWGIPKGTGADRIKGWVVGVSATTMTQN